MVDKKQTLGGSVQTNLTKPTKASADENRTPTNGGAVSSSPTMKRLGDGTTAQGSDAAAEGGGRARFRRTKDPNRHIGPELHPDFGNLGLDKKITTSSSKVPKIKARRWRKRRPKEEQGHGESTFDFGKFLELFEQIQLTNSITDIKKHRERFEEFISKICKGKRKMEEIDKVKSLEECLEIMSRDFPKKYDDPGSISIPITIKDHTCHNALIDSGSSDNILPTDIYLKLGLKEKVEPATSNLEFADSSNKKPRGIVRNVLIRVMEFKYLADFTILDMERRENSTIILGRPFLGTVEANIDFKRRGVMLTNGNRRIQIFDKHEQVNKEYNETPEEQTRGNKKEGKHVHEPP